MPPLTTLLDASPGIMAPEASPVSLQRGAAASYGLPLGTRISTAEGLLPVEWLTSGDRIVSRSGMARLLRVDTASFSGRLVILPPGAFGAARPAQAIAMPPGQRIYLGRGQSSPLSALARERPFDQEEVTDMRLFRLVFARPEIVTAGGVQVCCGDASDPVMHMAELSRRA